MPTIRGRSTRKARGRRRATISRAYLHHLVKSGETLGAMLLSEINIAYYQRLMHDIRDAIAQGKFESFRERHPGRMGEWRYRAALDALGRHCERQRRSNPQPARRAMDSFACACNDGLWLKMDGRDKPGHDENH